MPSDPPVILVANKAADVYGSDLQLLESLSAMRQEGWRVVVAISEDGPLTEMMVERGAEVRIVPFPVLRRVYFSVKGIPLLLRDAARAVRTIRRLINEVRADAVYVNTVALPWWLLAARLSRVPSLCHVHEAEDQDRHIVLWALNLPLMLATAVIANSRACADALFGTVRGLRARTRLIYNGVPGPAQPPTPSVRTDGPFRLAVVARLAPRKAPEVALEAVAQLRTQGRDVEIEFCGTPFEGYEWFADELQERAKRDDLAGCVSWSGYVSPIWPALRRADAVLAPSLREPFGNAVIEAQLAMRPVIAAAALGHLETITDGVTGLHVPPGDSTAMAAAVARIMDDPALGPRLAEQGRASALRHFSLDRYRAEIVQLLRPFTDRAAPRRGSRARKRLTPGT